MRIRYATQKNGRPVKKSIVYTQDEHGIKLADVDRDAVYIVDRLRANGCETYIVGGAVRDLILKKKNPRILILSAGPALRGSKRSSAMPGSSAAGSGWSTSISAPKYLRYQPSVP